MRTTSILLCFFVAMVLAPPPLLQAAGPAEQPAGQQVQKTIAVGPSLVVGAPGDVEFSIRISPTIKTHELRVFAESESYYRSTTIGLDGLDSEPLHHFTWRSFPVGEYQVVGMLVDSDGSEQIIVRSALKVINR
ncbi:MAG: hypothetical protein F4057_10050 [Acidobacteria bacterium]|nr:hypothetical protein [Acidobacteriota bacterium]MYI75628.1 hypothetical protein [Acidobacteriota bacterium]